MKTTIKYVAFCSALTILTQVALAQQSSGSSGAQKETSGQSKQAQTGQSGKHCRVSELIGTNAKSQTGQDLGEIEDVFFNPETGQISFAILGRGGVLGIGEERVPVPWQAMNVRSPEEIVLNIDEQKLSTAPRLNQEQFSQLNNPDYVNRVYRFYNVEPPSAMGAPGSDSGTQSGQEQGDQQPKRQEESR